eukprot:scaffold4619_cov59-Phaeocystis_antarctica.AAC.4
MRPSEAQSPPPLPSPRVSSSATAHIHLHLILCLRRRLTRLRRSNALPPPRLCRACQPLAFCSQALPQADRAAEAQIPAPNPVGGSGRTAPRPRPSSRGLPDLQPGGRGRG